MFEHDASLQMRGKEAVAGDAELLRQIGMYVSDRFHARYCIAARCARPRRSPKVLRHLRWNPPAFTTMKVSNAASGAALGEGGFHGGFEAAVGGCAHGPDAGAAMIETPADSV